MSADPRSVALSVDIAASAEEVWKALTVGSELVRWFSVTAEVQPGVGGHTKWAWDDAWTWVSTIDRWEPGRFLGLVNHDQRPFDTEGQLLPAGQVAPATLAMEFTLETHQGMTRVKLVHSGFGRGSNWDDELEGVTVGWRFELSSLKYYLERFSGQDRRSGLARRSTRLSQRETWARLLGPGGFPVTPWPPMEDGPCQVDTGTDRFHGRCHLHIPDRDLSVAVDELGGGIIRIGTHQAAGLTGVSLWIASYSADQQFVDGLKRRFQDRIDTLFED